MIQIKISKKSELVPDPKFATSGSSGADLCAFIANPITLEPQGKLLIPTGLYLEIPIGYEGQVRPRSGLALKHGITVLNAPGTIDSDYRGEIGVILYNASHSNYTIEPLSRIAQIVFAKVEQVEFIPAKLNETERGKGGFGHTGTNVVSIDGFEKPCIMTEADKLFSEGFEQIISSL